MTGPEFGWLLWRFAVGVAGTAVIIGTLISAIKTFIVPRGINVWLTRVVFRAMGLLFLLRLRRAKTYEARDSIMAMFAPLTLFLIPFVLLILILLGFMAIFWALDPRPLNALFFLSGSSLLTLGYASVETIGSKFLEFVEATIGLVLIAMLIAYLPTMYTAFSERETAVALWEGRAGSPPSASEALRRSYRNNELEHLREVWITWQEWFAQIEQTHTSLSPLVFFRSPRPQQSWVTAAGTVLDTAAVLLSSVDVPFQPRAAFCIRSGYIALRSIADFYGIEYEETPAADLPIAVTKDEFLEVLDELAEAGVPLKPDREQAWQDFRGWRVNYDLPLLALASLTMAPYAPWVSDRSALFQARQPSLYMIGMRKMQTEKEI